MIKKTLIILASILTVGIGITVMSAFEAHVINVTAHIENALKVMPFEDLNFGTVFPQEHLEKRIWITTSKSFCNSTQRRVLNIDYKIVQKPKCVNSVGEYAPVGYDTHQCPDGYEEMPLLCPYLSKLPVYEDPAPYTDYGVSAFHDPSDPNSIATGTINKDHDLLDEWLIDLAAPCFKGMCSQDFDEFVDAHNSGVDSHDYILPAELESSDFGCDLWIEITDIY